MRYPSYLNSENWHTHQKHQRPHIQVLSQPTRQSLKEVYQSNIKHQILEQNKSLFTVVNLQVLIPGTM